MGLTITVNRFDSFDIGYFGFMNFRLQLAETYNKRLGELYRRWAFGWMDYTEEKPLTAAEFEEFKELGGDLLIFLTHKDTEGSFTPSESRKIFLQIKDLKMDYEIDEKYHGQGAFNVLERLKSMFCHSWEKKRRVIFS
jgi:hypothetical protein